MSQRIVGSNFDTMSRETTSQPAASKALPTDLVPQKSSRSLGIFKEQELDVQTNAKGGKFMSIEDSHEGALVCKADVEVLWEPGNFQDDGAKRVGVCFASNTDLGAWTDGVEQAVVDDKIIFQKPFPGVTRAELESQLQRAVQGERQGQAREVQDGLGALPLLGLRRQPRAAPRGVRAPQGRALVEARHVWLMARQWGVLFEVRHLMLEPLEAPCCPF